RLVRIECDRVCAFDPGEALSCAGGQLEEAAVGAVDVHPDALPGRYLGDLLEGVDRPGVGGPRGGADAGRDEPGTAVLGDELPEVACVESEVRSRSDGAYVRSCYPDRSGGLGEGAVSMLTDVD